MILGAHESISGEYANAVRDAIEDNCRCLQIFTKNQTQWKEPVLNTKKVHAFIENIKNSDISSTASHASYLINLASNNFETREKSILALFYELERCKALDIDFLIMHPGSHMNQGELSGLKLISSGIKEALKKTSNKKTFLLLETTAGQGTNLGFKFEHLAFLLKEIDIENSGICFDTCHSYAAGYDIKTKKGYEKTFKDFDSIIGLEKLKAFHLNDSKKEFMSKKDRHEHIGKGTLGKEAFINLMNDKRFKDIPAFLETPALQNGERGYKENIEFLMSLQK
jgi:deoxyribonuclease IV